MADLLLQLLCGDNDPVLQTYIEKVANTGLRRYQGVVQYGAHAGEQLYVHVMNCVFLIDALLPVLNLSQIETKVLFIAVSIHDLNKVPGQRRMTFNRLAVPQNVRAEIEAVNFSGFFIEWEDYLEDITELVRAHSGHLHHAGNLLDKTQDKTKLGTKRIDELKNLVRAVDVAGLATNFEEQDKKRKFLQELNASTATQYQLIWHKVSEQRGLLTNIIHNQVAEFLRQEFEAIPLFLYPEGTYYLVPQKIGPSLSDERLSFVGEMVEKRIKRMKSEGFSKFIIKGNQGIKISPIFFETGLPVRQAFEYIDGMIQDPRRKFKPENLEDACRKRLDVLLKREGCSAEERASALEWLDRQQVIPFDDDTLRKGELIKTFYIFLSDHHKTALAARDKAFRDIWTYLYRLLAFESIAAYDVLDPRYDRPYVIARDVALGYDALFDKIILEAEALREDEEKVKELAVAPEQENEALSSLILYVERNVAFSFMAAGQAKFAEHLLAYCDNNHRQCCYCSSSFSTSKWMSSDVLKGIKVQQFSNRLLGGQDEPKRYICPICQAQFTLEKLNYKSGGKKSLYLHLMPYTFLSSVFIESLRAQFRKLLQEEITAVSLEVDEAVKSARNDKYLLPCKKQSAAGIPVPNFSEVIGNTITLPLNAVGDSDVERYLSATEYVLFFHKAFGCKVLLTESSIPFLSKDQMSDIFLDGVPASLRGLIPVENLDASGAERLWRDYLNLRAIYVELRTPSKEKELLSLAQSFTKGRRHLFSVLDHLIERKTRKSKSPEGAARATVQTLSTAVNQIIERGEN